MPVIDVLLVIAAAWATVTTFVVALCCAAKSGDRALGYDDMRARGGAVVRLADWRTRRPTRFTSAHTAR